MEQIPSISRFAALSIAVFFSAAASAGGLDRDMAADMSSAGEAPGNQTSDMPSATLFEESAENQASAADDRMLLDSIPSPLNTLNPAVAEEIKSVVSRAPRFVPYLPSAGRE